MLQFLRNSEAARAFLLTASFGAAFACGAGVVLAYENRDRIIERFGAPQEAPRPETVTATWSRIETGLLTLERADIPLGSTAWFSSGGAIDAYRNSLLYVSPSGHIAVLDLDKGRIEYSPHRVPMNYDHLQKNVFAQQASFNPEWYRVQDILIVPRPAAGAAVLYVSHHVFDEAKNEVCGVISQTSLELGNGTLTLADGKWEEFYRIRECVSMEEFDWVYFGLEGGAKMLQLDGRHILFAVGDYGIAWELFVTGRVGRQYANDFSNILKISLASGEAEVFANGVRNPQGLARDADGQIWETEHGPQGGDEINLIAEGGDYGWPTVSLGMNYGTPRAPITTNPVQGRHDGFDPPAMAFLPSVGRSAVAAIPDNPQAFALWSGDLIATSLKSRTLYRVRRDGDRLIYAEPIDLGMRLRDIAFLENGWIALLGRQDQNLVLLRDITDAGGPPAPPVSVAGYSAVAVREASVVDVLGEPVWGRYIFRNKCSRCHTVNGAHKLGPPLNGVVNRDIGSVEGFAYSEDLAQARGRWTPSRLRSYMKDPQAMFPGTAMPGNYNLQRWERREIVEYLSTIE